MDNTQFYRNSRYILSSQKF